MIVFAHDGTASISGVWTTITAARAFDSNLLSLPKGATHFVRYTGGAVADVIVGEQVEGGTGGATAIVVANAIEEGAFGGSNTAGVLFLKSVSGTFEAETLTGATSSGTVAIIQDVIALNPGSPHPKAVLLAVETASIICTVGGVLAATTATQNYGITMAATTTRIIRGLNNIRSFYAINAVDGNGAIMKYELYY